MQTKNTTSIKQKTDFKRDELNDKKGVKNELVSDI